MVRLLPARTNGQEGAEAMSRRSYPSDLTDEQWAVVQPLLPPASKWGAPQRIERREIINGILYVNRTGCSWRSMPHDLPKWNTVYGVYWLWQWDDTWEKLHDALRTAVRRAEGREESPSAAVIDSQTVKTTEVGGERGYDGAKKLSGRKRHVLVDTLGLILAVVVLAADWADHDGACFVLMQLRERFPRLQVIWADSAYNRNGLVEWVKETFGWILQTILRPVGISGFVVLPKRWIVERTFAWLGRYRRHSKDYERTTESSEAMIYISMMHLMSRRLARRKT